ncbi:DNA-binding protein [Desulfocurvibacter africanus]|uniref:DNA-binding protein n=1 Tax=Desulfocurvibacter africanus TaxID=873 RepID=UPI002FDA83D4
MSAIATLESVKQACAALEGRGERVTLECVRKELGGGSNSTIMRLLRELKSNPATVREQEDTSAEPLSESVQAAMDNLGQAVRQATADLRRELTCGLTLGFEARLDEAKAQIREIEADFASAEMEIEEVTKEKKELASRLDTRDGQHQMLQVELERREEDLQALRGKTEEREAAHKDLQIRYDQAREHAETAEHTIAILKERALGEARARNNLETWLADAKDEIEGLRISDAELTSDLDALRHELTRAKTFLKDATERADRESRERQEHIERAARAREDAASVRAQLEAAQSAVSRLEADMTQVRKQDEERREQLREALALAQARQMELEVLRGAVESERADAGTRGVTKSTGKG